MIHKYLEPKVVNLAFQVLKSYGKSKIKSLAIFDGISPNYNIKIVTPEGSYVLRSNTLHLKKERTLFIEQCKRALKKHNFPVIPAVPNINGEYVTSLGNNPWTLTPYSYGTPLSPANPQHISAAAKLLATLHNLKLNQLDNPVQYSDSFASNFCVAEKFYDFINNYSLSPQKEYFIDVYKIIQALKINLQDLPQAWTHGDFYSANILFATGKITAVIDFDNIDYRYRVYDLAKSIFMLCRPAYPSFTFDATIIKNFLEAYNQEIAMPLTQDERDIIPMFMFVVEFPEFNFVTLMQDIFAEGQSVLDYKFQALQAVARNLKLFQEVCA